jgi:PII-like signaling protein
MRALDGEKWLARIFVGSHDLWHHQPLYLALVERLRREGFAGATVLQGIAGYGAHSVIHHPTLLRLSADLPIVIEVVDDEEKMRILEAIVDEMVADGLLTLEKVRVVRYDPGPAPR